MFMYKLVAHPLSFIVFAVSLLVSCTQQEASEPPKLSWDMVQDSTSRIHSVTGFSGPEAVRYDPDQDVYFVSNFAGDGNERNANGFISRVSTEGTIDSLQFMTGTGDHPLHAPRGMFITGDTLWAADIDGVHGFHTTTGEQVRFIDFTNLEPGFLNDIVAGPDDALYVTDTGTASVYRVRGDSVSVVIDDLPHSPNGITLSPSGDQLVLAPWGGDWTFHAWDIPEESMNEFISATSGGNFDGIEFVGERLIAASQSDSSLHMIGSEEDMVLIHVPGPPADIGIDTQRNQVAVPYVALNRVDIWQLPEEK